MTDLKKMSFIDVLFSWGMSLLILLAIGLTIAEYVNGYTQGFKEFLTEFIYNLVYAGAYIVIRMIPIIDERPPFYPKKEE